MACLRWRHSGWRLVRLVAHVEELPELLVQLLSGLCGRGAIPHQGLQDPGKQWSPLRALLVHAAGVQRTRECICKCRLQSRQWSHTHQADGSCYQLAIGRGGTSPFVHALYWSTFCNTPTRLLEAVRHACCLCTEAQQKSTSEPSTAAPTGCLVCTRSPGVWQDVVEPYAFRDLRCPGRGAPGLYAQVDR